MSNKSLIATYSTLDDNLAAALVSNGVEFHPDYQGGRGSITLVSAHGVKEGWYFQPESKHGVDVRTIEAGWKDPDAATRFAALLDKVEGPVGDDLRAAYPGAVTSWQRMFQVNRARLMELKHGRTKPEDIMQIDKGGHRWLFHKSNERFRKDHNIR